jgi:hypothetical protein
LEAMLLLLLLLLWRPSKYRLCELPCTRSRSG